MFCNQTTIITSRISAAISSSSVNQLEILLAIARRSERRVRCVCVSERANMKCWSERTVRSCSVFRWKRDKKNWPSLIAICVCLYGLFIWFVLLASVQSGRIVRATSCESPRRSPGESPEKKVPDTHPKSSVPSRTSQKRQKRQIYVLTFSRVPTASWPPDYVRETVQTVRRPFWSSSSKVSTQLVCVPSASWSTEIHHPPMFGSPAQPLAT